MTPEIKAAVTKIVLNTTLTKEERSEQLAVQAHAHMSNYSETERLERLDDIFEEWNLAMVEIVQEHNLGRH